VHPEAHAGVQVRGDRPGGCQKDAMITRCYSLLLPWPAFMGRGPEMLRKTVIAAKHVQCLLVLGEFCLVAQAQARRSQSPCSPVTAQVQNVMVGLNLRLLGGSEHFSLVQRKISRAQME
jgi:hypothetical protein